MPTSSPVSPATFARVEVVQQNAMLVVMTCMDLAMRSIGQAMGQQMSEAMGEIGQAIGEALGGERGGGEPHAANVPAPSGPAQPSRADLLKALAQTRAGAQEDEARKAAFRAVMTEDEGQRVLALPAKHLPGLPALGGPLSDEQLADYCDLHMREDPRWGAFMREFMEIGSAVQGRMEER